MSRRHAPQPAKKNQPKLLAQLKQKTKAAKPVAVKLTSAKPGHHQPKAKVKTHGKNKTGSGLTHATLWAAIDSLAATTGQSASGLARAAGLDATSFNKSKRRAPDGKPRWPSTESLAKILAVTNHTLTDFAALVTAPHPQPAKTEKNGRKTRQASKPTAKPIRRQ